MNTDMGFGQAILIPYSWFNELKELCLETDPVSIILTGAKQPLRLPLPTFPATGST